MQISFLPLFFFGFMIVSLFLLYSIPQFLVELSEARIFLSCWFFNVFSWLSPFFRSIFGYYSTSKFLRTHRSIFSLFSVLLFVIGDTWMPANLFVKAVRPLPCHSDSTGRPRIYLFYIYIHMTRGIVLTLFINISVRLAQIYYPTRKSFFCSWW